MCRRVPRATTSPPHPTLPAQTPHLYANTSHHITSHRITSHHITSLQFGSNGSMFMLLPLGFGFGGSVLSVLVVPIVLYVLSVRPPQLPCHTRSRHTDLHEHCTTAATAASSRPRAGCSPRSSARAAGTRYGHLDACIPRDCGAAPPMTAEQKASHFFMMMGVLFVLYFVLFD